MEYVYENDDIPKAHAGRSKKTRSTVEETGQELHMRMVTREVAEVDDSPEDGDFSRPRQSTVYEDSNSEAKQLFKRVHPPPPASSNPIYSLAIFSPESSDGTSSQAFIATGGRDGVVRLFYMNDNEPFAQLEGHTNGIMCLCTFQPNDEDGSPVVISGGRDKTVRVWVVSTRSSFTVLKGHEDTVWCVQCVQPRGLEPIVVSGDLLGNILIFSMLRGELLRTIVAIPKEAKERGVMCLQLYCPPARFGEFSSPLIISGGEDQLINLWTVETGELLKVFLGHSDVVMCLALCENFVGEVEEDADFDVERDTLVVSGSKDGTVRIWSMATTEMLRILRSHTSTVFAVCAQPLQFFDGEPGRRHKERTWMDFIRSLGDIATAPRMAHCEDDGPSGEPRSDARQGEMHTSPLHADPADPADPGTQLVLSRAPAKKLRYIVNLLITSAGKDGLIYTWNLATGRSTRTLRHHSSAVTGVSTLLNSDGRTTIISASTDGSVAHLVLSSALRSAALDAYHSDCDKQPLPSGIVFDIPDEFQKWPHLYLLIRHEKLTVDQFFAMENFVLFSEAIRDGRCDFVERFLPMCPSGLVHLCRGAGTALCRNRKSTRHPERLLRHILTNNVQGLRKELSNVENDIKHGVKALQSNLQDVLIGARAAGKKSLADVQGASILRQAIAKEDIRIILCILDNWRVLLNAPPHDWMEQCKGAFTRLEKEDLLALAKSFPLIFQNFITSLRLQNVHPFIVRDCNAKARPGKEYLKKGTNGNLRLDVELWKTPDSSSKETMAGQYLPLAYAADLDMLRAYADVCNKLDSVAIFQSDVGSVAIKFAWSRYGLRQHMGRFALYVLFILAFIGFLLSDSAGEAVELKTGENRYLTVTLSTILLGFVCLQLVGHCRQCIYEGRTMTQHFLAFWPMLELLGAIFIAYSTISRLIEDESERGLNTSRFFLSLNLLIQMLTALSFFRAFDNTGPLVAMVIRIVYEIRFYLALLAVVLFGFTLSFWCLCSQQYSHPAEITYHNLPENPAPVWYQAPIAGNDDPQGTYAFSTIQGAYLESFIFLTGQFSVVPFTACGYNDQTQTINKAQRGFAIFLSAIFAVLVQILMVNVLIALMTESYGRMSERGLAQARLMQAQLICESAGMLGAHMQREKARGNILQPKILHILRRAGTHSSHHPVDPADANGGPSAHTTEQVAQHTRARGERIDELLRSQAVEVDNKITEQEDTLFEMRKKLDALLLKTKRLLL